MLWVDKYRPRSLSALSYHPSLTRMLQQMVTKADSLPHLLFYGPSGAGKKTRVCALLHGLFGKSALRIRSERKSFKVRSKTVEISVISSNFHLELSPSDCGVYDRVVVQDIIKEIASSALLSKARRAKSKSKAKRRSVLEFKVVVLNGCDQMTRDAQNALRRTMEKYMATCRLILVCESVSKVIDPLRSRCLAIRVPLPTADNILPILQEIAADERIELSREFALKTVEESGRNLRRALLMLQVSAHESARLSPDKDIKQAPWRLFTRELARIICEEQSPQRLMQCRNKVYELLANCIPADLLMAELCEGLMHNVDDCLRAAVAKAAAFHEHRLQLGSKPVMHIEAFIAEFMCIYKQWMSEMFADDDF